MSTVGKELNLPLLKEFTHHKSNVPKMMQSVFKRMEDILVIGENTGNQHYLLFPHFLNNYRSLELKIVWLMIHLIRNHLKPLQWPSC